MITIGSLNERSGALRKAGEQELLGMLRTPSDETMSVVRDLRIHMWDGPDGCRLLLKQLPYVLCGIFSPLEMKRENFAYADRLFVWIRYCPSMGDEPEKVRDRITASKEVQMCFSTPKGDGLMVMFALSERCYNAGLYSAFCRKFSQTFAIRNRLLDAVDPAFSDVTRRCFIGSDRQAYYNPNAEKLRISDYIDTANPYEALWLKRHADEYAKTARKPDPPEPKASGEPDSAVFDAIREKLCPEAAAKAKARAKPKDHEGKPQDPGRMDRIADELRKDITDAGIDVTGIFRIRGGRKIRAQIDGKHAEVNLFEENEKCAVLFSPLSGADPEFSRILADMVRNFLENMD